MLIDLLTQEYPSKSVDQNQARLINMYLDEDKAKGKYKIVAYSMPGLTSFCDTTKANVRALLEHNDVLYAVAGNTAYSINSGGTATSIGTLNTSSGFCKIAAITGGSDTNSQLVIIDGTNGYHYNIGTSTATFPISDGDFPQTCTDITTQDDYFIVQKSGSIRFHLSAVSDGTSWAALDFASKTGQADRLVAIVSQHRELWLLGSKTVEAWVNTGASFPFERMQNVFVEYGCAAKSSVVLVDGRIFMLARDKAGGYVIISIDGYQPKVLSTSPIAEQINSYTTVSDCIAYSYMIDGHSFIDFTFPTPSVTYTYDITTGIWISRQSSSSRFLGSCSALCYNKSLVGDYNSGKIFTQSTTVYQENSAAFTRQFNSPPIYNEGKYITIDRIQVDVETNVGSSKTFLLEKSTDGGRTWATVSTFTIPSSGGRVYATRLGTSRNWMFRISTTTNAKFSLLGVQAEVTLGYS